MKRIFFLLCFTLAPLSVNSFELIGSGVSLTPPTDISDDFSSDTSANYTNITGTIVISGGTIGGASTWSSNYAYHETPTGSNDHYIKGKIQTAAADIDGSIIGLRCNGTTGYYVNINNDATRLMLYSFNGSTVTSGPDGATYKPITGSSGAGSYTVKLTISGSTIHAYIDLDNNGVFTDANEDLGVWSGLSYTTGQYVVVGALRGSNNNDYRVDDLSGGLL